MLRICFDTEELETRVSTLSLRLIDMESRVMATLEEVVQALAVAQQTALDEKQEVLDALSAMNAQIVSLQEQITNGTAASPSDLDAVLATITDLQGSIEGIQDTPAPPPVV